MPQKLPLPSTGSKLFNASLRSSLRPRKLLQLFLKLAADAQTLPPLPGRKKKTYQRLFWPLVTLWGMILQRLGTDHTLDKIVTAVANGDFDVFSTEDPLSKKLKSQATASFSNARRRLSLSLMKTVFVEFAALLLQKVKGRLWKGWELQLLDGSTVRLPPEGDIPKAFPPHSTQHKGHWCLLRVVIGFCLRSGMAMGCAVASTLCGEQALACGLILAAHPKTLFIGDRNFGIFRIVQTVRQAQGAALVRMTRARAFKLARKRLVGGLDLKVWWRPSRHDQLQPDCPSDPVAGRLLVCWVRRPGCRPFLLYLFTTLLDQQLYSVQELLDLYGLRWHVELNLRYIKTQMDLEFLNCKSADMAEKEWYAGLMAYNLIRGLMLLATDQKKIDPLGLSFSACARRVEVVLRCWAGGQPVDWDTFLLRISQCTLPKRKKIRPNEPRRTRQVREKFDPLQGSRQEARRNIKNKPCKS